VERHHPALKHVARIFSSSKTEDAMFLKKIIALLDTLLLIASISDLHAKGTQIVLHLKSGEQIKRELYSVSDSSLTLYAKDGDTEYVRAVMIREIQKVALTEKPKIELMLKDGRQICRLLDSVSDSSLSISEKEWALDGGYNEIISEVRSEEIRSVILKGESKIIKGMTMGFLIGAGTGVVLGLASGDNDGVLFSTAESQATLGGILLGGAGLVVGGVAGGATSTGDKEIEFSADHPFSLLKPLARNSESKSEDK
jgi:hypothetical protein